MLQCKISSIVALSLFLVVYAAMPSQSLAQAVNVWLTTDNQRPKLNQQSPISFSATSGGSDKRSLPHTGNKKGPERNFQAQI